MCEWLGKLFGIGKEKSPNDWLPKEAISAVDNNVVVDLSRLIPGLSSPPKAWIPPIPGTGSMLPNFNHEHNNILVVGTSKADQAKIVDHLQVGDIAVYRIMSNIGDDPKDFSKAHKFYAIHRIIKIDTDDQGRYFIFKGDNNSVKDPYKVRGNMILYVSVGTIF